MHNRFHFNSNAKVMTAETINQLHLLDLPTEILWLIIESLPRKDRASFAFTAKIIAVIAREVTFRQIKPSTEKWLSTSVPAFTLLNDVETRLGNLIDYTYALPLSSTSIEETHLSTQLRLANSIRLLLEYMYDIAVYSTSLALKLQKGYEIIESDDAGVVADTPSYDYIDRRDADNVQKTALRIKSDAALNLSGNALKYALNKNMAELTDTLRSISIGLTPLNTVPASNFWTHFFSLFTCGLYQTFTPQENKLICLLLACTNAFAYQLNELNAKVCAPVIPIEPQRINRR